MAAPNGTDLESSRPVCVESEQRRQSTRKPQPRFLIPARRSFSPPLEIMAHHLHMYWILNVSHPEDQ